jgi:predicted DNA-binding transcriptional regulator YafY
MDSQSVYQRLHQEIELYLQAYPHGLTTSEVAERLDVTRQTVHKDLQRLDDINVPIVDVSHQRYAIDPKTFPQAIQLSLAQAWFLYIPLRRIVRAQLHRYPFVNGLLQRITAILNPRISEALTPLLDQDALESDDVFTQLTAAWRSGQYAEIKYKPPNEPPRRHLIAPYWFEPAVWSDSIYLIAGLQQRNGQMLPIVLKVDRIQAVSIRSEVFAAPSPQEILEEVEKTWGIWGANDTTHVVLRFSNRVQERLRETWWHPTQTIREEPDGSVIWEGYIAEPLEMMPWLRGWGPDIEVLEPQSIRDQIALDAERVAIMYGRCEDNSSRFFVTRDQG